MCYLVSILDGLHCRNCQIISRYFMHHSSPLQVCTPNYYGTKLVAAAQIRANSKLNAVGAQIINDLHGQKRDLVRQIAVETIKKKTRLWWMCLLGKWLRLTMRFVRQRKRWPLPLLHRCVIIVPPQPNQITNLIYLVVRRLV
jgi:hypothetical protein